MKLEEALDLARPLNQEICEASRKKWDDIAKPLRSLGRLEELVIQLSGIRETVTPKADKKAVLIFCADNGIVAEGVTQTSSEVTAVVTENFTKGIASINSFAKVCGADVFPIDMGIYRDMDVPGVINRKIAYGTENMTKGPAMTRQQCLKAIEVGIDLVGQMKDEGYDLLMTGEMGIGNTSTSSAILSVLENVSVEEVTGKGAGLTSEGILRKIEKIKEAIAVNKPNVEDPIDVLSKLGGYDICGMVGAYIGAAVYRIPIIIDGFISVVAANCAIRILPVASEYMFASHCSAEPAGQLALRAINKKAYIECGMCLGEGTGAVIGAKLFDFALAAYNEIADFETARFEHYELLS